LRDQLRAAAAGSGDAEPTKTRVFLSYSRKDAAFLHRLQASPECTRGNKGGNALSGVLGHNRSKG